MKTKYIAVPLLASLMLAGCKQNASEVVDMDTAMAPEEIVMEETGTVDPVELVPVIQTAKPVKKAVSTPAKTTEPTTPKAAPQKPLKGTIYVEADGAQGRVWGHVTMNGDKGTGTIHDWDENTWAVTVTRHGDELFAVDQNSRLYVFKLK